MNSMNVKNYNDYSIRKGVTQFVAEFTNQSYENASECNCEMIDWIVACIENVSE